MPLCPNMPKDWEPPAPAWRCTLGQAKGVVVVHFGSQDDSTKRTALDDWLDEALADRADAPVRTDRAAYTDVRGKHCRLALCYWLDRSSFGRWFEAAAAWWVDDARLSDGVGYFREVYDIPTDRLETIWSSPDAHATGLRDALDVEGPMREHAYWGAARDRLEISYNDQLLSPLGSALSLSAEATEGKRIALTPPENLCVIRSGQDWSRCNQAEAASYFSNVEPALRAGMEFLALHRQETGCIDCRLAHEFDGDGEAINQTFGLAQFLTLGHLEDWSKSHETHLTIFDRFMAMLDEHDFDVSLHLYHELFVTGRDNPAFEYINCHNRTGLLSIGKHFDARGAVVVA
jgi:aldoxime dehydratase